MNGSLGKLDKKGILIDRQTLKLLFKHFFLLKISHLLFRHYLLRRRRYLVVAETGSSLSHAAIVAREYGIPAVMACEHATQKLVDGDQVEVDGSAGTVRRLR
mgnify:CR=1 FL=1